MTIILLSFRSVLRAASRVGQSLFGKHLLLTNAAFSASMGATGDLIQQHYEIVMNNKKRWEPLRTLHMTIAGITTGIACHYWYIFLDRRLPGRHFKTVIKKVLYDQILFSPVCLTVYFSTLGILEGSAKEVIQEELYEKGKKIYIAEWIIWPPAQILNFYVLPTKYRVVFDNLVSLGFDIYSPYIKYKELKKEKDVPEDLE